MVPVQEQDAEVGKGLLPGTRSHLGPSRTQQRWHRGSNRRLCVSSPNSFCHFFGSLKLFQDHTLKVTKQRLRKGAQSGRGLARSDQASGFVISTRLRFPHHVLPLGSAFQGSAEPTLRVASTEKAEAGPFGVTPHTCIARQWSAPSEG